ncbi:hypothetical protein Tco_0053068 [Tanacetum coccineum]
MGDKNPICTLRDYSRNTIELLVGNNVVPLRSDTIRLVQNRCLFHGLRSEDPNQHLKDLLKLVDLLDLDGENRERTRLRTAKLRNYILMFQQHHGESLYEAWTRFKDLLQKVPHHGIDIWLQVQIFYDHVNPVTRQTIDQSAGGKLRDRNAKESWALLEDLTLYDNESWNDPRDFTKLVKAIALPQDVPSTSDRRLIELENQVHCLIEAYLAPTQPTQVNKVTTSCEIYSGPHDTQYCMEDPEQAFVEYASLRTDEVGELNKNSSAPKRDYFVNSIVVLSKDSDTEDKDASSTNAHEHDLRSMVRRKEEAKKQESEMEREEEVEEVFDDETEEEDDDDTKYYNSPPAIKELVYHEWLLKNPQPSWVKAKIRAKNLSKTKISCMIGHILKKHAYIEIESPINIMSRNQYN